MTMSFTYVCLRHLWKCCTLNHGNCQNFSNSWIWFQTDIPPRWKPHHTSAVHSCSGAIKNEGGWNCLFTFADVLVRGLSWEETCENKRCGTPQLGSLLSSRLQTLHTICTGYPREILQINQNFFVS